MFHRVLNLAAALCVAVWLVAAPAFAESSESKSTDQHPAAGQETAAPQQKVNEFAEAQKLINGPAGNPECVRLGRNVIDLLWKNDLDTAFRNLDLYDRFGCPGGHVQATFRCFLLHSNAIDPKKSDATVESFENACWINPALAAVPGAPAAAAPNAPAAPAAAAPNATTNH
jgi:hypothetical protein